MLRPNVFLIGAPKCGTSSLYTYLRGHPQVFMPHVKEPLYFCTDFAGLRQFPSEAEYLSLFDGASREHVVIGEASSRYLYSAVAVPSIERFAKRARYIVMLRNPIDLVYSLHGQLVYQYSETERDFETAWRLQEQRAAGVGVPATCPSTSELLYGQVARLGQQLERLFATVERDRVHLIFYDDFRANLPVIYRQVVRFLGLSDDGRVEFPRVNPAKTYRSEWLARLVVQPPYPLSVVKSQLKQRFGWKETGVGRWIYARMTVPKAPDPLPEHLRSELRDYFREDVDLLSALTGRNLDHWLRVETTPPAARQPLVPATVR